MIYFGPSEFFSWLRAPLLSLLAPVAEAKTPDFSGGPPSRENAKEEQDFDYPHGDEVFFTTMHATLAQE